MTAISVETLLRRLLSAGALPEINDGDLYCRRKLSIASFVYSSWTANNSAPAQLAPRFLDGSVAALESFVQADAAVEPAALPEVSQPRPTAQRGTVDRRDADTLLYDHFVTEYMAPNRPVVISGCGKDWPATRDWVNASDGSPNLDFMQRHFGHARVTVTDCSGGSRSEMTVSEYIDWLRDSRDSKRVGETAIKYLKDWHHFHEFRNVYQAYDLPAYFSEDWLNDWYDLQSSGRNAEDGRAPASDTGQPSNVASSDYRFVYLGCKGSSTPLHADVLRSFSWSHQVAGRKLWRLLPPEHTHLLFDRFGRELAPSFTMPDESSYPNLHLAKAHVVEFVQDAGETVFVPSGWHHTVDNLEESLSINCNWLNAFNIVWAWRLVQREYHDARSAIEDCRATCSPAEFEELVARNQAANCGINCQAMYEFLDCIARRETRRLRAQQSSAQTLAATFNLQRIALVLAEIIAQGLAIEESNPRACLDSILEVTSAVPEVAHMLDFARLSLTPLQRQQ